MSAAELFQANCARCHGEDGGGDTFIGHKWNIPDLRSDPKRMSDAEIVSTISNGRNQRMPAWQGKLTPEEIAKLAGYIRELGKLAPKPETK